jgi:hypothetical protein
MPRLLALAVLLLLAVPATASAQTPLPEGLSRAEPISVAGETIALSEIRRWARIAARAGGSGPPGLPELGQAADLLVSQRWIEAEAHATGIRVSDRRVRRELREQADASFPSLRALGRFLRQTGQTLADIRFRVRLDLLSNRLRNRVLEGIDDPEEQMARLDAFVLDFSTRWKAQTLCTPLFTAIIAETCSGG